MRVEDNNVFITVQEWCYANATRADICRINRMWLRHLDRTIGRDAPLSKKEEEYDKWRYSDFSIKEWQICGIKDEFRDGGALISKLRKEVSNDV